MLGDEAELLYGRPPLSQDYLSGANPFERILMRPAAFWAERHIDMLSWRKVVAVDPIAKVITLLDGSFFAYQQLIWAT